MRGCGRGRTWTVVLAALALVAAAATAATAGTRERPAKDVAAYAAQLRQAAKLAGQASSLTRSLGAGTSRGCAQVTPAVNALAAAADAAKAVFERYRGAKTRYGTHEEIELIAEVAVNLREARAALAKAAGEALPVSAADRQAAVREISLFQEFVALKIGDRLQIEGLADVLRSASFRELRTKVVAELRARLRQRAEAELKRLIGFGVRLDVPLRQQIRDFLEGEASRLISRLAVTAGPAGIVISILGQRIVRLIGQKLQEALRNKGDLERRTQTTLNGFEQLRRSLNALQPDTPLDRVRDLVRATQRERGRTKFLQGDLARAKRTDLIDQLKVAETRLAQTLKQTRFRFLLDSDLVGEDFGIAIRYATKVRADTTRLAKKLGCTLTAGPAPSPAPAKAPTAAICQPTSFPIEYFSSLGGKLGEYNARFQTFEPVSNATLTSKCVWVPAGSTAEAFVAFVSYIPVGTAGTVPSGNCLGNRPDSPGFYHSRTRQLTVSGGNRLSFQNAVGGNEKILKQVLAAAEAADVGQPCPKR